MNCLSFYFVSPPILQLLGNTSFMSLYLFGGLACSFVSLFFHKGMSQRGGAADGASGTPKFHWDHPQSLKGPLYSDNHLIYD